MNQDAMDSDCDSGQPLADVRRRIAVACRRSRVAARLALGAVILLTAALVWTDLRLHETEQLRADLDDERNVAISLRERAMAAKEDAYRMAQVNEAANAFLGGQLVAVASQREVKSTNSLAWLEPLLAGLEDREVDAAVRLKLGAALMQAGRFDEAKRQWDRALAIHNIEFGPEAGKTCDVQELIASLEAARTNALALPKKASGRIVAAPVAHTLSVSNEVRSSPIDKGSR